MPCHNVAFAPHSQHVCLNARGEEQQDKCRKGKCSERVRSGMDVVPHGRFRPVVRLLHAAQASPLRHSNSCDGVQSASSPANDSNGQRDNAPDKREHRSSEQRSGALRCNGYSIQRAQDEQDD